jgi:hypothetical protein
VIRHANLGVQTGEEVPLILNELVSGYVPVYRYRVKSLTGLPDRQGARPQSPLEFLRRHSKHALK